MRTQRDVEAYLERLNRRYRPVEGQSGNTYLVTTNGGEHELPPIALRVDPPLVVMRASIGEVPKGKELPLFQRLLELNSTVLIHLSFGLEEGRVVLVNALALENLDYNELEAVLDEFDLTLVGQVPALAELIKS
jgi:hypothetical protein